MATQTATLPIQIGVNALSGGNGAEDRTIVDFVTLLTRLCSDEGFQTLRGLFEKNEALAKEVKDQGIANEKNFETIARIKQESADLSQRLQQATEEGESLSKQLAEAQSDNEQKATELQSTNEEVQRLSKQIEENNASIQELSETKSSQEEEIERQNDDIASLQRSLKQLRSFTLDMKSLEDSEPEINASLRSLFTAAYKLMEDWLHQDLPEETLESRALWEPFKQFKLYPRTDTIPLPISNSAAAKQMRLSMGLAVLGGALKRHVFQPIYVGGDGDNLSGTLDKLMDEDPDHETHARGVILKVMGPKVQQANGHARARKAALEVSNIIASLIPSDRKSTFESDLRNLCDQAVACWLPLQQVAERITVEVEIDVDEWVLLPPVGANADAGDDKAAADESADPVTLDPSENVFEVWPSFIANDDFATVLHHGYALTEEQVKEARTEADKEAPRRADRERLRRESTIGPSKRERRESRAATFLAPVTGDESADD